MLLRAKARGNLYFLRNAIEIAKSSNPIKTIMISDDTCLIGMDAVADTAILVINFIHKIFITKSTKMILVMFDKHNRLTINSLSIYLRG